MEEVKQFFEIIFNTAVPIIGISVGSLAALIFGVISRTSFGKKSINIMKRNYEVVEGKVNDVKEAVSEVAVKYEEIISKKDEIIAEMKQDYENKLAIAYEKLNKLEELALVMANNINNVKIKAAVAGYTVKNDIVEISEVVKEEVHNELDEIKARLEELEHGKDTNSVEETL